MNTESQPVFMHPRQISYALLDRVDKEIDRLEADGILERVKYASWRTPMKPIVKNDVTIRLCADYKVTSTYITTMTSTQYLHECTTGHIYVHSTCARLTYT
jgi:hypothetical protein